MYILFIAAASILAVHGTAIAQNQKVVATTTVASTTATTTQDSVATTTTIATAYTARTTPHTGVTVMFLAGAIGLFMYGLYLRGVNAGKVLLEYTRYIKP